MVGIGINADWAAADFPTDLAAGMTSLREAARGRPIDGDEVLDGFIDRLEGRLAALRGGYFDIETWAARQVTTGRRVVVEGHADEPEELLAVGVDAGSGALLVADPAAPDGERPIHAGEITRIRVVDATRPPV